MARIYIDRNTGRLSRTDLYFVALALKDGTVIDPLEPRRLFPLSNQNEYIALLDKNEKEVALIRHVEDLDEESAKVLQDCFADYYRIPHILRLLTSDDRFGALTWCVIPTTIAMRSPIMRHWMPTSATFCFPIFDLAKTQGVERSAHFFY